MKKPLHQVESMDNEINNRRSVEKEDLGKMQQCTALNKTHMETTPSKVPTPIRSGEGMQFHIPSNLHLLDDTSNFQPVGSSLKDVLGSLFILVNESQLGPIYSCEDPIIVGF